LEERSISGSVVHPKRRALLEAQSLGKAKHLVLLADALFGVRAGRRACEIDSIGDSNVLDTFSDGEYDAGPVRAWCKGKIALVPLCACALVGFHGVHADCSKLDENLLSGRIGQ
jgi:hypothetical protein